MRFKKIIKLFNSGNVCVFGLRGTGKDILFGNVIARKKNNYISNLDYTNDNKFIRFNYNDFRINNTYKNFVSNDFNYYSFPYDYETDIYISDCGIYFPSQFCNKLNNDYPDLPIYMAISRQVSHNNLHFNAQNLNRVWDKIREQSDIYIMCRKSFVILGFCFMFIRIYDKYDSAVARVKPFQVRLPLRASKEMRMNYKIERDRFYQNYGHIKNHFFVIRNKSKHNTYEFENLLKGGVINEKNNT